MNQNYSEIISQDNHIYNKTIKMIYVTMIIQYYKPIIS